MNIALTLSNDTIVVIAALLAFSGVLLSATRTIRWWNKKHKR